MTAELHALVAHMPFAEQIGMRLLEAGPDRVVAELAWSPRLCTTGGVMHGGALITLADTVGALVAFLGLPPGASTATIASTTHMFRPVTGGTVVAEAILLHRGRSTVSVQTSIRDSDQRLVTQTTQVQAIRQPPAAPAGDRP